MEKKDEELVKTLVAEDEELNRYYHEHLELKRQLDEYKRRLYLTPEQDFEMKALQKRKLQGKDRIMEILQKHRSESGALSA